MNHLAKCTKWIFFFSFSLHVGLAGLSPDLQWEGTAALGPILLEGLTALSELQMHEVIREGGTGGLYM